MEINISNIEELIFLDKEIQKLMPELQQFFDQWLFSKKGKLKLKSIEKKSIINVLNSLDVYRDKIESYFNEKIFIKSLKNNISKSYEFDDINQISIDDINDYNDLCISMIGKKIYITAWR